MDDRVVGYIGACGLIGGSDEYFMHQCEKSKHIIWGQKHRLRKRYPEDKTFEDKVLPRNWKEKERISMVKILRVVSGGKNQGYYIRE